MRKKSTLMYIRMKHREKALIFINALQDIIDIRNIFLISVIFCNTFTKITQYTCDSKLVILLLAYAKTNVSRQKRKIIIQKRNKSIIMMLLSFPIAADHKAILFHSFDLIELDFTFRNLDVMTSSLDILYLIFLSSVE